MKKFLPTSTSFSVNNRGFTLVELLVAVSIVAILAVVGLVAYSAVSARGRDARRIAEIDAIQKAMEKNYQPGAATAYQPLATSDFANSAVPTDPRTAELKCGTAGAQVCAYCFYPKDTAYGYNVATAVSTCLIGTVAGTVAAAAVPTAASGYVVCANLETKAGVGGATYYCKSNSL